MTVLFFAHVRRFYETLFFAQLGLVATLFAFSGQARAHGRPPLIGQVAFHPDDPDFVVARATWGLVLTEDGGESWRWMCAAVMGTDPTREDPVIRVMPDGAILAGNFSGIWRSTPERCDWEQPDPAVTDVFTIDLDVRPSEPGTVFALITSGIDSDQLFRSDDMGRSWSEVSALQELVLMERVRLAPSDPTRVYLSGAIPNDPESMGRRAFFFRSDDAGETFTETELPLLDGERNAHLLAVDPSDPDRALVHMTRRATDDRPQRLLLTEDGGATFRLVMEALELSGAAFSPDGSQAWATARTTDGLFRSDDGGATFTQLTGGNFPCVGHDGTRLWMCVDELRDDYAMARTETGDTIDRVLVFDMIRQLPDCPRCSQVGYVCPEWFPDLAYDLRLDGVTAPDGGMTGAPRDASVPLACTDGGEPEPPVTEGCACRAGGGKSSHPAWLFGVFLASSLLWRRRVPGSGGTRRQPASSSEPCDC